MTLVTEEKMREYLGKKVLVNVHLSSHMGRYRDFVYVGGLSFADSCEELLDGTRALRGLSAFPQHLGLEDERFTIYNVNPVTDKSKRLHFSGEALDGPLKVWDAREK